MLRKRELITALAGHQQNALLNKSTTDGATQKFMGGPKRRSKRPLL